VPDTCFSYLLSFSFWTELSIGGLVFLQINHMSHGRWGVVIRRQLEAAVSVLPICLILFIPIAMNYTSLYPWAKPDVLATDEHLHKITAWLNPHAVTIRTVCFFIFWTVMGYDLLRRSARQDERGPVPVQFGKVAAPGICFLVVTVTAALTDWIMSLEPHWFSTIYGVEVIAGNAIGMLSLSIILVAFLADEDKLRDVAIPNRFHDLGNLLFASTMFWTYVNFSQFILMWSANLSEEAPYYNLRRSHGWNAVAVAIIFLHFVIPFYALIVRKVKRSPAYLSAMAALLLFAEWVYKFWLVVPPGREELRFAFSDLFTWLAIGGIWFFFFIGRLRSRPLVPLGDPELVEAAS
jgi:hypothetical protein